MPVLISLLGIPGARGAKNAESACCAKVFDDWHLEKFEKILVGAHCVTINPTEAKPLRQIKSYP